MFSSTVYQSMIGFSGIIFFLVGYVIHADLLGSGNQKLPPVIELTLNYDPVSSISCASRPKVSPQIFIARSAYKELALFVDTFSFFGDDSNRPTGSFVKYASGITDDANYIRMSPETIKKMYLFKSANLDSNCIWHSVNFQVDGVAPDKDKASVNIQLSSVLSADIAGMYEGEHLILESFAPKDFFDKFVYKGQKDEHGTTIANWSHGQIDYIPEKGVLPVIGIRYTIECKSCDPRPDGDLAIILRSDFTQSPHTDSDETMVIFGRELQGSGYRLVPVRSLNIGRYEHRALAAGRDYYEYREMQFDDGFQGHEWRDKNAGYRLDHYMSFSGLLMGLGITLAIESAIYLLRLALRVESKS